MLVNMPTSQGSIGDIYNFRLEPSLTLGCGSWGGNSVSENVGVKHLLNVKTVAERRENMLWFRLPPRVYLKPGSLEIALGDGSPIDAAKITWLLYERPEITFEGLAMRFMDIRKRIYALPELGKKATMVAIPTARPSATTPDTDGVTAHPGHRPGRRIRVTAARGHSRVWLLPFIPGWRTHGSSG